LQNTAVNKDAKLLSAKSACISDSMSALWFGFESDNWIMKQKIILEIVPWVDRKANRGWTTENRKSIVNLCKSSELGRRMLNGDDFCVCVLDKIQQKYKFAEYQKLLSSEKIKAFSDFGNYCLTDKTANKTILNSLRADAGQHIKDGRYDDAIRLLQGGIIENGNATAADHYLLGKLYLLTKQPVKALKTLKQGEKLDDSELLVQVTLAHAYLLNDEYQEAKEIHKKYRNQNVTTSQSWIQRTKEDFAEFKRVGIQHPDFERLLKLLDVQ
jgi:tetratricopeptide (TPR) repeat protein